MPNWPTTKQRWNCSAAPRASTPPRTWALLAEYKVRVGQRDEEWHLAREKALALGGADRKLVDRMLAL